MTLYLHQDTKKMEVRCWNVPWSKSSFRNCSFTKLGKIFFSLPITDILYTFVLGKTESFKKLNLKEQSFGFCVELPIKAKRNDMRLCSVSAHEKIRIAGKKKVNEFRDGFIILLSMLKLFFNIKWYLCIPNFPLKIYSCFYWVCCLFQ